MIDLDQIKLEQINDFKAIQLITFVSQNNKFELNSEAAQFLSQLRGNIAFVVICGKYRTGKSFLLNKLIDVQNDGIQFQVSPTTNSCTQGIWLYTKPIINKQNNLQIYFLDTEGSESGVKSQTHDAKIFALAILMSSTFMFNSIGCIDEQSIIQLHLTTLLSKNIQVQDHDNSNNENILGYYTPKFIWLLRDFVLEMKDNSNNKITSKEYLELALHDDRQYQSESSKKVRKTLLTCFKDRNCFQFVRPVINENELQKVNQLPNNQLRQEFQQQITQFREYLLKNTSPKQLNGVNLNGRMFCKMIETFLSNFNKGNVPIISTAWEHIVETECQQGLVQAKQLYETNLKKYFGADEAKSFEEIFQILKKIRDESLQTFHYIAGIREKNNHFEEYKKKLLDFMTEKENLAIRLNDDMNNTKNEEVIAEVSQKLKENLDQETFTIDNLDVFFQHFNEFLTAYDKKSAGTEKANTLIHFLQNHHPIIVKQLVNSVVQKYSKNKNQVEEEKAIQQVKENQLLDNIKILEQNISQHETKIKKLDQDKVQLEGQKKQLSDQLNKLQVENKTIKDNIKDVDELQNVIAQKNEEIQGLQKIITVRSVFQLIVIVNQKEKRLLWMKHVLMIQNYIIIFMISFGDCFMYCLFYLKCIWMDSHRNYQYFQQHLMDYTNQKHPQNYSQMEDLKTLDLEESVSETIMRDLRMIAYKLKYVLIPKEQEDNGKELRNWDLWGPLIFCLTLAMTLSFKADSTTSSSKSDVFAIIFVLIWVGAFVVTLNAQLLGGKVSFFQSVCLLGYCVFPINIEAIIIAFVGSYLPFVVKLIPVIICFAWSAYSSVGFMASLVPPHKKKLAVYPVFLFYLFLSWFSLIV